MKSIKKAIGNFLENPNIKVLAIKGEWGIGKTHYWNNEIIQKILNSTHNPLNNSDKITTDKKFYSYVSLFNIENIKDLKTKIYYESKPINKNIATNQTPSYLELINQSTAINQELQKIKIDNYLICLDDIERKSESITLKTILGYVSELKEQNNNKIVIIFNENELSQNERDLLDMYKDKIIDHYINFPVTANYNQEIILKESIHFETIKKTLLPMNVTNMRILKFIEHNIDLFLTCINKSFPHIEKTTQSEVISTIAFNTWLHYQSELKIKISELDDFFNYRLKLTDEKEAIRRKIINYGYTHFEKFEKEIITYLINGYFDEERFIEEIKTLSEKNSNNAKIKEINNRLTELWGIYNGNFIGNDADFLEKASRFIKDNINDLSYESLQQIIEYINKIDKSQSTQKYIEMFIEVHKSTFTKSDIKFFLSKTKEPTIITMLNQIQEQIIVKESLQSTLYKIIKSSGWNPEDEEFLDLHSEDEIYQWLKKETDSELLSIIRGALRIFHNTNGESKRESFGRKLNAALLQIWQEGSTLDKLRITDFLGIPIPTEQKKAD